MTRKKAGDRKVRVGNVSRISGKVAIAGRDIYEGYTVEQVSGLLKEITTNYRRKPFDGRCPYKGLDVFDEEDADLFFGRERLVEDLVGRVKESRTVFITGPSGSGKSSLVRAGLIHALKNGVIRGSDRWMYETMKPGREPIKELSLAFSRLKAPDVGDYFLGHAREADVLYKCAESVLSGQKNQRFVLFVDQFEEVFTQINQEDERQAFINMLAHAGMVENGRVIVLFAMRSDFVSNCATYQALNEMLNQEFRQIGAMQPHELVSAISLPAMRVGLPIENELIARIINDMKGEPGALPLMQFALKDLFDSQQAKSGVIALRLEDYLQRGGIHKALERHADETFARLNLVEQELARAVFSRLIEIGRGTSDTRRTALFDELVPASADPQNVSTIVQKLADARLIITDEQAGVDTVTISHETLIDAWPWLKKLVNENRDVIALQNEIASDAKEWEDHRRDPSYLYTGARLTQAREQLGSKKLILSGLAQEFVQASNARQRRGQMTRIAGVSTIIAILFFGVILFSQQSITNANTASTAQAASTAAFAQKATAQVASTLAVEQAEEAQRQTSIALARQLVAQAQAINETRSSKQMIAVMLAAQSMKIFPSSEAMQVLLNNNFAAHAISRMTHSNRVYSVVFSPDSKYVVSGSADGTARVWEAATGKEIVRMTNNGAPYSIAFSPDSKYIVSGIGDGTVRVWEATTGKEVARMAHNDWVYSVAFSPDGKYVVSGSRDGTARVWEAITGVEVARMTHDSEVFSGEVTSVAFSPDSKYVVSGSYDTTSRVWEAATGREVARMTHGNIVYSVAFSSDSKLVVSGSLDGTAQVWEATTGKEVARMTQYGGVSSVAFSPDGKYVVSGSNDELSGNTYNTARVWEATTGKEVARMTFDGGVTSVAFSPDGKYVVSGSLDGSARVWDTTTSREVARMTHDDEVTSVAFSPDGKYVVSGSADTTARVWEMTTSQGVMLLTHHYPINSVAFSPNGKYVVAGNAVMPGSQTIVWESATRRIVGVMNDYGSLAVAFSPDSEFLVSGGCDRFVAFNSPVCNLGTAIVWEASTGKEISRMTHDDQVTSVAFSPDGKYIVSGSYDNTARVWEAATGKEVARMTHDDSVQSVAFSPDGEYVVSGGCDKLDTSAGCNQGTARVWEATTGKEIARITHDDQVTSVAFSPDGKYVISGSYDTTACVWEAATGKEVARMTHDYGVTSVAFSPDGKYVVSGSADTTARVWEAATGKGIARVTHDDSVQSVAFSPDGKYVVSGSADTTARVWDAATGKEIARVTHDDSVQSVAFSPDGKYVVSGSYDNTARMWIWQVNDLLANACAYMPRNLTRAEWEQYIGDALPYQSICPDLLIEPEILPIPTP